jgi:anti-sigma B factor antagonist
MEQVAVPPQRQTDARAIPTLQLSGELDLAVAPSLHDELDRLFTEGANSIVVDLMDATFLDSTALGVLVSALNRCESLGGQLHLIVTEPQILRVLRITGLTDVFSLHAGRDALRGGIG